MELFVLFASFIGAWLLVAGSIYQAALELRDQDIQRDRIKLIQSQIPPIQHASVWFWLLPPLKLLLERRLSTEYRKAYFGAMTKGDTESLIAFMNKATAWGYVSLGGFLIAVKETFELTQFIKFNNIICIILIVVLAILSFLLTVIQITRGQQIIKTKL